MDKENKVQETIINKPVPIYQIQENLIKQVELEPNLIAKYIEYNGKMYIDIRRYWRNYPTKKGIRIEKTIYDKLINIFNDK